MAAILRQRPAYAAELWREGCRESSVDLPDISDHRFVVERDRQVPDPASNRPAQPTLDMDGLRIDAISLSLGLREATWTTCGSLVSPRRCFWHLVPRWQIQF